MKMELQKWLTSLLVLFLTVTSSTQRFTCHDMTKFGNCKCADGPEDVNVDCGFNNSPYLNIQIRQERNFDKLEVDCKGRNETWDLDALPNLNIGKIIRIAFNQCPFIEGGFEEVLKALGVEGPLALTISNPSTPVLSSSDLPSSDSPSSNPSSSNPSFSNTSPSLVTLDKSYLSGMVNLQNIIVSNARIVDIEENVFEDLNNLRMFDSDANHLRNIPQVFRNNTNLVRLLITNNPNLKLKAGDFSQAPHLLYLGLMKNRLEDLESGVFAGLTELKVLELSDNYLTSLPDDILQPLENLTNLSFLNNRLKEIPAELFRNNKMLEEVRLRMNSFINGIPNGLFTNLTSLQKIWLDFCQLKEIPGDSLDGCKNLIELSMEDNKLESLPEGLFRSTINIKILRLRSNKISYLPEDIFAGLTRLEELDLGSNALQFISENVFRSLSNLNGLFLNDNNIVKIHELAFSNNSQLRRLNLNNNKLTLAEYNLVTPFGYCESLSHLYLMGNQIENFFDSWFTHSLAHLDLRKNHIKKLKLSSAINRTSRRVEIDLRDNSITDINLDLVEEFVDTLNLSDLDAFSSNELLINVILYVNNNPIVCDCEAFSLVNYFQGSLNDGVRTLINLQASNLTCAQPENFKSLPVVQLKPDMLTCPVVSKEICPENCDCVKKPYDKSLVIDCSNRHLREAPKINRQLDETFYNQTKVNLRGNSLMSFPNGDMGYDNVTELLLSNNWISEVDWIPPKLEVLELNNNNLTNINNNVLVQLNKSETLRSISLHNNPWKCNCSILSLSKFVLEKLKKVSHANITCSDKDELLIHLKQEEICKTNITLYLMLAIIIILILSILLILSAIYYKFQQEIKVWLFARHLLLWWVKEEDVDKDKEFDAFISYSSIDHDFVLNKLQPVLESGPQPYKLCVHYRDFTPGDIIAEQIAKSVANSKRTIVVLTPNFLQSIWGKMEFRVAHETAMKERRARLIVIVYGDEDLSKGVFDEVKTYLNTKTYIKWGDPAFWDKLTFALPHKNFVSDKKSQKLQNIMINIDKFELMGVPTTPNIGSTPPILADPLILKGNPLRFNMNDLKSTPPAECGLNTTVIA